MIIDLLPIQPRKRNTCMKALSKFSGSPTHRRSGTLIEAEAENPDRSNCTNLSPKKPFERSCNPQLQLLDADVLILPPPQVTACKRRLALSTSSAAKRSESHSADATFKRQRCQQQGTIIFDMIERNRFCGASPCEQSFVLMVDRKALGCLLSFLGLRELVLLDACCCKSMRESDTVEIALDEAWDSIAQFYFIFK